MITMDYELRSLLVGCSFKAYYVMHNVLCNKSCVERFNYVSIIEFWYVLRWMNAITFDIYNSTLTNFISSRKQQVSWPIL